MKFKSMANVLCYGHFINNKIKNYIAISRVGNIKTLLLCLSPALSSYIFFAQRIELTSIIRILLIVTIGKALGCIVNDFFDCDIDAKNNRTSSRALCTGSCGVLDILFLTTVLSIAIILTAMNLLLETKFYLSMTCLLSTIYPLIKRVTHIVQFFLGITISSGVFIGTSMAGAEINATVFIYYLACVCWVVAYDSIYAMSDIEHDIKYNSHSILRLLENPIQFIHKIYNLSLILFLFMNGYVYTRYNVYALVIFNISILINKLLVDRYIMNSIDNPQKSFSRNCVIGLNMILSSLVLKIM